MKPLLLILLLLVPFSVIAQEGGWKADPEVIRQREENRPDLIWCESQVPEYTLPDPLRTSQGDIVQTPEQWRERRMEILELFRTWMYGRRPGLPDRLSFNLTHEDPSALDGSATLRQVTIESAHQGRTHEFELLLFLPNKVERPIPVFLLMNNRGPENTDPTRQEISGFWPVEEVIERGYGIAAIQNGDLAPDDREDYYKGVIKLYEGPDASRERAPEAWGALAAWGWGASRVMDYFETVEEIDESRIAVLGHSRGGKASLWTGAEDERFALVISNQSGCGGAALSRRQYGETVKAVNRFTHWFNDNFETFNDREDDLPFDQHMLIALTAPRAVYVGSADRDLWADPRGEYLALSHASPVYALWKHVSMPTDGMPGLDSPVIYGPRAYHVRSGSHDLTPDDWHNYMDFADTLWPTRPVRKD